MILHAPYELKNNVGPSLRDALNTAMANDAAKNCEINTGQGLFPLPKGFLLLQVSIKKDETSFTVRDVRAGFLALVEKYMNGCSIEEITQGELTEEIDSVALSLFNDDREALIQGRLEDKIEVYCRTEKAKLVAIKDAWQDMSAIAHTYGGAMVDSNVRYNGAVQELIEYVDRALLNAQQAANKNTALVEGHDYHLIP